MDDTSSKPTQPVINNPPDQTAQTSGVVNQAVPSILPPADVRPGVPAQTMTAPVEPNTPSAGTSVQQPISVPGAGGVERITGSMAPQEAGANSRTVELPPMSESKEQEIPPEVEEFIQKEDKENVKLDRPVVHAGQVLVADANANLPMIELPLTQQGLQTGLTAKVNKSVRWLAEWCVRLIKKFHGRVVYSIRNPNDQGSK